MSINSGYFTLPVFGDDGGLYGNINFSWTQDSSDDKANTSVVSWELGFSTIAVPVAFSEAKDFEIYGRGSLIGAGASIINLAANSSMVIRSGTFVAPHDMYGNCTVNFIINLYLGTTTSGIVIPDYHSTSLRAELTPTDRAPRIASVGEMTDETKTLRVSYYNPAVSNITALSVALSYFTNSGAEHTITTYRSVTNAINGAYTFNLTTTEQNKIRQYSAESPTLLVTVCLKATYTDGNTVINKSSKVPCRIVNATPTIVFSVVDTDNETINLTGNSNKLVLGYSDAKVTVTPQTQKYATVKNIEVIIGNRVSKTSNSSSLVTTFDNIKSDTIQINIEDSRGYTNTLTTTLDAIPYTPLTCSIEVDSTTFPTDDTATTTFKIGGIYYNNSLGNSPNQMRASYRYKVGYTGTYSDWISISPTKTTTSYTHLIPITANYESQVDIEVNISDALVSIIKSYTAKPTPVFDWGEGDFNFNVPVTHKADATFEGGATFEGAMGINNATVSDMITVRGYKPLCVVEFGQKSNWVYVKYSNGIAECWKTVTYEFSSGITTAWGGVYTSGRMTGQSFPFTFAQTPICHISLNGGYAGGWVTRSGSSATPTSTSNTGSYEICRGSSYGSAMTFDVTFYAKGLWSADLFKN